MLTREAIKQSLMESIEAKPPVIGVAVGSGFSAKQAIAGEADFILVLNAGRFRTAGISSLAALMPYANSPTVGLCDGVFRQNLEETGMGYDLEVEMIRKAHELDLLTTPYVFSEEDAVKMTKAGADILVAHMGLTTKGTIGAKTALTLDECVKKIQAIHDVAKSINPDILVICHGGPIAEPEDAAYVLSRTKGIIGFYGASSMERLPTEKAIAAQVKAFKELKF